MKMRLEEIMREVKEEFDKYEGHGAYHWRWYRSKKKYRDHVHRVKEWIKEKNVIDIGAGDGVIVSVLGIKGIDSNKLSVEMSHQRNIDVIFGDACALPYKDGEFESAFMGDTLEHLKDPELGVREARRVITKFLYIATPLKSYLSDPYEYNSWTVGEFTVMVEKQGFKTEDISIIKNGREDRGYLKFRKI